MISFTLYKEKQLQRQKIRTFLLKKDFEKFYGTGPWSVS